MDHIKNEIMKQVSIDCLTFLFFSRIVFIDSVIIIYLDTIMAKEQLSGYCVMRQLFFDHWVETNIEWNIITPFEDDIEEITDLMTNTEI